MDRVVFLFKDSKQGYMTILFHTESTEWRGARSFRHACYDLSSGDNDSLKNIGTDRVVTINTSVPYFLRVGFAAVTGLATNDCTTPQGR